MPHKSKRKDMVHPNEEMKIVPVTDNNPESLSAFWDLGRDYLSESKMPPDERERFLQSILVRQSEPDRWLLLLKYGDKYLGFVHMKIDKDERPGWGFILEFYIVPSKRRLGWGRKLFNLVVEILQTRNVTGVWLLTDPATERFWFSLGFKDAGKKDRETRQKIMVRSV